MKGDNSITAVVKEFVIGGLKVTGIRDRKAQALSSWAEATRTGPYCRQVKARFYDMAGMLLEKLAHDAPRTGSEHMFALQNLFDLVHKNQGTKLLLMILDSMNAIPSDPENDGEHLRMMKDNMASYARLQEKTQKAVPLSKFLLADFNPSRAMERVVLWEVDNLQSGREELSAPARVWLDSIGFKVQDFQTLVAYLARGSR